MDEWMGERSKFSHYVLGQKDIMKRPRRRERDEVKVGWMIKSQRFFQTI